MQAKIDQLERELDRVRSQPLPLPLTSRTTQPARLPTPAERYLVNPRSTVTIVDDSTNAKPILSVSLQPVRQPEERMAEPKANSPLHDLLRKIAQTANRGRCIVVFVLIRSLLDWHCNGI